MTNEEKQAELVGKLTHFLQSEMDAVRFCLDLTFIAHVWDDLIDKDKAITDSGINEAFTVALIDIPGNRFFRDHHRELVPLMMNAILQWKDANTLEKSGDNHDLQMAHMLRASILQIFAYCAMLVGGRAWSEQIGPDMRRMYAETFEQFQKEMNHA